MSSTKQIVRSLTFSDFTAHSAPILKTLGILTLKDLFKYKTILLMFDFDRNHLPKSLSSLFLRRNDVHHRNLRDESKNKLYTAHRYNNRHGNQVITPFHTTELVSSTWQRIFLFTITLHIRQHF